MKIGTQNIRRNSKYDYFWTNILVFVFVIVVVGECYSSDNINPDENLFSVEIRHESIDQAFKKISSLTGYNVIVNCTNQNDCSEKIDVVLTNTTIRSSIDKILNNLNYFVFTDKNEVRINILGVKGYDSSGSANQTHVADIESNEMEPTVEQIAIMREQFKDSINAEVIIEATENSKAVTIGDINEQRQNSKLFDKPADDILVEASLDQPEITLADIIKMRENFEDGYDDIIVQATENNPEVTLYDIEKMRESKK